MMAAEYGNGLPSSFFVCFPRCKFAPAYLQPTLSYGKIKEKAPVPRKIRNTEGANAYVLRKNLRRGIGH